VKPLLQLKSSEYYTTPVCILAKNIQHALDMVHIIKKTVTEGVFSFSTSFV